MSPARPPFSGWAMVRELERRLQLEVATDGGTERDSQGLCRAILRRERHPQPFRFEPKESLRRGAGPSEEVAVESPAAKRLRDALHGPGPRARAFPGNVAGDRARRERQRGDDDPCAGSPVKPASANAEGDTVPARVVLLTTAAAPLSVAVWRAAGTDASTVPAESKVPMTASVIPRRVSRAAQQFPAAPHAVFDRAGMDVQDLPRLLLRVSLEETDDHSGTQIVGKASHFLLQHLANLAPGDIGRIRDGFAHGTDRLSLGLPHAPRRTLRQAHGDRLQPAGHGITLED